MAQHIAYTAGNHTRSMCNTCAICVSKIWCVCALDMANRFAAQRAAYGLQSTACTAYYDAITSRYSLMCCDMRSHGMPSYDMIVELPRLASTRTTLHGLMVDSGGAYGVSPCWLCTDCVSERFAFWNEPWF